MTRASVGLLRVYLDTNVLIRGMERTDAGAGEVGRLIEFAERDRLQLVTSELTLSEVLVGPIRRGDDILATAYLDLLTDEPIFELLPVTRDILIESVTNPSTIVRKAAGLRACGDRHPFVLSPHRFL